MALWADDYPPALALLRRVFPPGLLRFLQQKRSPSVLSRPTSPTPQVVRLCSMPRIASGKMRPDFVAGGSSSANLGSVWSCPSDDISCR